MEEESNREKKKGIIAKKDTQVATEEKLEEVDLGTDPQKQKPISISSKLLEEEKSKLILLLKKFRDVFARDYSKMLGLDPRLVVHTLNIDPEAKFMAQLARVFHAEIEEQIVKDAKAISHWFH